MEGKVTGIKPFGAFVALPESKTGLVHISEVSYEFVQDLATVLEAGQTVKVKVISIAPDGKIALSIKQTQPAPERAPRAPRSPRPQGQQGSNGGARPAGGRPPRRDGRPGRDGSRRGPRPSGVPAREFADRPRNPEAAPQAPVRTERINDAADFELFGKIEL